MYNTMKLLKILSTFCFLLWVFNIGAQTGPLDTSFVIVARLQTPTVLTDSTWSLSATNPVDQTGNAFGGHLVNVGDRLLDQNKRLYEITAISSQSAGSISFTCVQRQSAGLPPFGIGQIFRTASDKILPSATANPGGISEPLQASILNSNFKNISDLLATIDSTRLIQDSILVYYQQGVEVGRDTILTSDDQTAAEVPFTPASTITATDAQAAIVEALTDANAYADANDDAISDGDKGDITVSGSGTLLSIDEDVVGPDELSSTAVTPGQYSYPVITVDQDGRVVGIENGDNYRDSLIIITTSPEADPLTLSPTIYYKADQALNGSLVQASNGETVQTWIDQGALGVNVSASFSLLRPDYVASAINGHPAIDWGGFDGMSTNTALDNYDIVSANSATLIFVGQFDSPTTIRQSPINITNSTGAGEWYSIFPHDAGFNVAYGEINTTGNYNDGAGEGLIAETGYDGAPHVFVMDRSNDTIRLRIDGVEVGFAVVADDWTDAPNPIINVGARQGESGANGWDGYLAEIFLAKDGLTSDQITQAETFLRNKYDISPVHPDTTIIALNPLNELYYNDQETVVLLGNGDTITLPSNIPTFNDLLVDSTRLVQDSILVYYQNGSEVGRDTISGTGGTGGGSGDVTGPGSSTDNAIATFDGTGNTIQSSSVTVDDSGNIATSGTVDGRDLSADGAKLDNIEAYATSENRKHYIVGLGQSNMEGRNGDPGTDARILLGNPSGTTSVWNPTDNNPLHAFAVEWISKNPKDTLVCFQVAASGISISQFYPSINTYWTALDTMLSNHGDPYVSAVLWMQGEADRDGNGISTGISGGEADTTYYNAWQDSIYSNIIAEPWFDNRRPIIVGLTFDGPGATYSGITRNAALARIGTDTIPWTLYVDSDQLATSDNLHFTDESYTRIGQLMYEGYKSAPYYVPQNGGGSSTDDQTAAEVNISDSGGYYTGTEVETALQEVGADLAAISDTDDQIASEVNITDSGAYYTGTEVETALQEIGPRLIKADSVKHKVYYAGFGQSNMEGHEAAGDLSADPLILRANENGTTSLYNPTLNEPMFQVAKRHRREHPEDTVVCIIVSLGGTSISEWYSGGTLRTEAENTFSNHGNPWVKSVFWLQGEKDRDNSGINVGVYGTEADDNYYQVFYDSLYQWIITSEWADQRTPIVVGTLYDEAGADYYQIGRNNALLKIGRDTIPNTLVSDLRDLSSVDGIHYSGTAVDTIGFRFFSTAKSGPYYTQWKEGYTYKSSTGRLIGTNDSTDLRVSVELLPHPGGTRYLFPLDTFAVGDTIPEMENWEGLGKAVAVNGAEYMQVLPGSADSAWSIAGEAVRWTSVPYVAADSSITVDFNLYTGTDRGGVVIQMHDGVSSKGWVFINLDAAATLYRLSGSLSSKVSVAGVFTDNTDYRLKFKKVRNDSIYLINRATQDTIYSYEIPGIEKFTASGGVGFISDVGATGNIVYYRNIEVKINEVTQLDSNLMQIKLDSTAEVQWKKVGDRAIQASIGTIAASKISVSTSPTNYTPATATVEGHLSGLDTQLSSDHVLAIAAPSNGDTVTLTSRETLVVMQDIFADPATIYLDGSALASGAKVYVKYGDYSSGLTIDRDDDNDPGNFIETGATSGSTSVGFTGIGFSAFIKSGSSWYQMY